MARSKPNYFSAIASVALVLLMVGFFALTALYGNRLVNLFKEKIDIWVELKPEATETEAKRLMSHLSDLPFVKSESVQYITREEAAATMREDLGDESLLEDLPNLMRNTIRLNVMADYLRQDSLNAWRETMRQDSAVADVFFEAVNTGNAGANLEKIGRFTLILALLLVFSAVSLIHNTIRLALYSNRFVIKNQELVGASWSFITRPYLLKSLLNGLVSGVFAVLALLGLIAAARNLMPELASLHNTTTLVLLCVGLIVLGIFISALSTWWVVNKFLRMRLDDLY